jgi:hypothetical protein
MAARAAVRTGDQGRRSIVDHGEPPDRQRTGEPAGMPRRPGLSLIDAGLGAGCLASRAAMVPLRTAARGSGRLTVPARRALAALGAPALMSLSRQALRTLAQIGALQRTDAQLRLRSAVRSAFLGIAADRDVAWLVRNLATAQLEPLIDDAMPIVFEKLAEQPEALHGIVQSQSRGIAAEAGDTTRHGARRADFAVDSLVDRLLRRRAASAQPPPEAATTEP